MTDFLPLLDRVPILLLVAARIAGVTLVAPIISSITIPTRFRAAISFLVAAACLPALMDSELAGTEPVELNLISLVPLMAAEIGVGAVIGWMAMIPLVAAQLAGTIVGTQLGLGFAETFDPATDSNSEVVGSMLFWLSMVGFLTLGGHVWVVLAVLRTFEYVPLGTFIVDADLLALASGMLLATFELAVRIATPILALVALESLAMGFMSKTTPQLNILSLGFPLRILAGISILAAGLYIIGDVLMVGIHEMLGMVHAWATNGNDTFDGAALRRGG